MNLIKKDTAEKAFIEQKEYALSRIASMRKMDDDEFFIELEKFNSENGQWKDLILWHDFIDEQLRIRTIKALAELRKTLHQYR